MPSESVIAHRESRKVNSHFPTRFSLWQTTSPRMEPVMLRTMIRLKLPDRLLRRPRPRTVVRLVIALAVCVVVLELLRVMAWTNKHELVAGKIFRTAQLSGPQLTSYVKVNDIKTVINLRGFSPGPESPWYAEEARTTHALGISQEDITLSANRLPPRAELVRLIEILDRTEYPVLIHCKRGADRTGLAATLVLLLYSDANLDRARRQLWPRYGHFQFGRTAAMDDFYHRYEAWLGERDHTPTLLRDWIANHYLPGPASGTLVAIHSDKPFPAKANTWSAVRVKATNTSQENWEFQPGNYAGIHVQFTVQNELGEQVASGQAGLFRKSVPPGESLELTLAVPPIPQAGLYTLRADLMNGTGAAVPIRQTGFYQFGADPLMMHVKVE
jgi:protein tyrosine phosphatase (PTP) superfamily phosphohydrolase (DUF442 family)